MTTISESFNIADQSTLPNFTAVTGTAGVASNQGVVSTNSELYERHDTSLASTNHKASLKVVSVSTGNTSLSVLVRCSVPGTDTAANSTFYMFRYSSLGVYEIYKRVSGTFTLLASFTDSAPGFPYTLELEANGTSLVGRMNGTTKVTVTDSAITTGTRVGIRGTGDLGDVFDDFTAADLAAGPTPFVGWGIPL